MFININNLGSAIIICDEKLRIVEANYSFYMEIKYSKREVEIDFDNQLENLLLDDSREVSNKLLDIPNLNENVLDLEFEIKNKNTGSIFVKSTVRYDFKEKLFYVVMTNIDDTIKKLDQVKQSAQTDFITELYHVNAFIDLITTKLHQKKPVQYEIIKGYIKGADVINTVLGYHHGEQGIKYIASVIKNRYQDTIICRTYSNEIILFNYGESILAYFESNDDNNIFSTILKEKFPELNSYVLVDKYGCYAIPFGETNVRAILSNVDVAFEIAKYSEETVVVYDDTMKRQSLEISSKIRKIEQSFDNQEIQFYLKPILNINANHIEGAIIKPKWLSNDGLNYDYANAIQLVQDIKLIEKFDRYVLKSVCAILCQWKKDGIHCVPISINIHKSHVRNKHFLEYFSDAINIYKINPEYINFIYTENLLKEENFVPFFEQVNALGVSVSANDLNVYYELLKLSDNLKIRFVKLNYCGYVNMNSQTILRKVVNSVMNLVQSLNTKVLVAGIEDDIELDFLSVIGCDMVESDSIIPKVLASEFSAKYLVKEQEDTNTATIRVQCFPDFAVFVGTEEVVFTSKKAKEILAYLVSNQGAFVNVGWIASEVLDDSKSNNINKVFQSYYTRLKRILQNYNIGHILDGKQGQYRVRKECFQCDYYDYLNGNKALFKGELLRSYSWSEPILSMIHRY